MFTDHSISASLLPHVHAYPMPPVHIHADASRPGWGADVWADAGRLGASDGLGSRRWENTLVKQLNALLAAGLCLTTDPGHERVPPCTSALVKAGVVGAGGIETSVLFRVSKTPGTAVLTAVLPGRLEP